MSNNNSNLNGLNSLEKFFKESIYHPTPILLCEGCLKIGRKPHIKLCQSCFEQWVILRQFPPPERKSAVKKCALCDSTFSYNYKRVTCGNVCRPCYNMMEEAGELPNKKPKQDTPAKEPEQNCYHMCIKCSATFTGSDVLDIVLCPDCHTSETSPVSITSENGKQPGVETTQTTQADDSVVANQYYGTSTCNVLPLRASTPTIGLPNSVVEEADQSQMQFLPINNGPAFPTYNNTYPVFDLDPNMHPDFGSSPHVHPDFGSNPFMHPSDHSPNMHPAFGSDAEMRSNFDSSPNTHLDFSSSPSMPPAFLSNLEDPGFGSDPNMNSDSGSSSNRNPDFGADPNMYQYHYQADQAQWDSWNFNDQFAYSDYQCQNF